MKTKLFVGFIVILILSLPPTSEASDFKVIFSAGGNFRSQPGYEYHYSYLMYPEKGIYAAEYLKGNDNVSKINIYAPDLGIGLSYKKFSILFSFCPFSGIFTGTYDLSIPSKYFWEEIAEDSRDADSKLSGTSIGVNLRYSIPIGPVVQVYLGTGLNILSTKMSLLKNILYYEYYSGFLYLDHSIRITEVQFSSVNVSATGFNAFGGVEFMPVSSLYIFLEGRYQSANKAVPHPLYSQAPDSPVPIKIDFSGFVLSFGIRYALGL